jgi:hypothetical protein
MPMLTDDMSQVPAPADRVDEGWYHVRVSRVEIGTSESTQNPVVKLQLKIQGEGPMLGRIVPDNASLQSQALFKLKGYYKAVGYNPGREGHDPEKLLDCELFVYVQHGSYQGNPTINIPPYSIRSLQEGPGRGTPKAKKEEAVA